MYGIGIDLDHMIIWNKNYFNKNKFEETISSICLSQTEFKVEKDFDTIADIFNHLKKQYNKDELQLIDFQGYNFEDLKIIQVDKEIEKNEEELIFEQFLKDIQKMPSNTTMTIGFTDGKSTTYKNMDDFNKDISHFYNIFSDDENISPNTNLYPLNNSDGEDIDNTIENYYMGYDNDFIIYEEPEKSNDIYDVKQQILQSGYPIPKDNETFTQYMTKHNILDVKDCKDLHVWWMLCDYFFCREKNNRD